MAPSTFEKLLLKLGFTHEEFALLTDNTDRQVRRWASGESEVPKTVAMLLYLARKKRISLRRLAHVK